MLIPQALGQPCRDTIEVIMLDQHLKDNRTKKFEVLRDNFSVKQVVFKDLETAPSASVMSTIVMIGVPFGWKSMSASKLAVILSSSMSKSILEQLYVNLRRKMANSQKD
ncbi:MAG: hypothetical protein EZS28_048846 [Streblomastix strix]|uniref:Uncharacterized protein n=1 Tax=Streblomastix strix TaxID=222440 RepID=A0A5J4TBL6_9EUKA|nr:MAG: hypothetical protein EZS28_048846 [Streblomastix strix]